MERPEDIALLFSLSRYGCLKFTGPYYFTDPAVAIRYILSDAIQLSALLSERIHKRLLHLLRYPHPVLTNLFIITQATLFPTYSLYQLRQIFEILIFVKSLDEIFKHFVEMMVPFPHVLYCTISFQNNESTDGGCMSELKKIATIHTDFQEKFGIPRQSNLIDTLKAEITFEPGFRDPNELAGLEEFSHLWLLWEFSENVSAGWSAMVYPPRLGGRKHMGVFATRSPFRPNPIGLSSVKLESIEIRGKVGPVLHVAGADLLDGTPILDIKPYIRYTDSHPDAVCGFADRVKDYRLKVVFPHELLSLLPEDKQAPAIEILRQDPRPAYQDDPERRYGVAFAGYDIRFHVKEEVLTVCEVVPYRKHPDKKS